MLLLGKKHHQMLCFWCKNQAQEVRAPDEMQITGDIRSTIVACFPPFGHQSELKLMFLEHELRLLMCFVVSF